MTGIASLKEQLLSGRRWLYVLGGVGIYALAGFFLAPWLLERTLKQTLSERLALHTEIDALAINPFTLTLSVENLSVTQDDGTPLAGLERLFVNFELVSLFRWAACFDELHLIGPRLVFERFSGGDNNLGRLAAAWTRTAEPVEPVEPGAEDAEAAASSEAAGLPRLVIADLQIVGGAVRIIDHVPSETFSTNLAPIDLAVRDFSTLPNASGEQQVTVSTESGATLALTGALSVNPLELTGRVTGRGSYVPLAFRYFRDQLALPLDVTGGNLSLELSYALSLADGELSAAITDLGGTLTDLTVEQPDQPPLVTLGALTVSGGELYFPEQRVHLEALTLERVALDAYRRADGAYLPPGPTSTPTSGGEPAGEPGVSRSRTSTAPDAEATPDAEADANGWVLSLDSVRLSDWRLAHTDLTLPDGRLALSRLDAELTALSNAPGAEMTYHVSARPELGGELLAVGHFNAVPSFSTTGELTGSALVLGTAQPYLDRYARVTIEDGTLSFGGSFESTAEAPFRYRGDLSIDSLALSDREQSEELISWSRLHVDQLALAADSLEVSELTLTEPYVRLEVETDGSTNFDRMLLTVSDSEPDGTPAQAVETGATPAGSAAEAVPPPRLLIASTVVNDGRAHFTDLALPLPFQADITRLGGRLTTLASHSTEPASVALEGQVNEYGQLTISGSLLPFAPAVGTDIQVSFANVDMPRMSPYTIKFAGRRIDDGRIDLDLTYQVVDQELDGSNHLVVRDLKLGEHVEHPDAMDLPLDLAVALLKDPNGVVDLEFPVRGTLNDPEFSYSGAILKAFSNLILGIATAPFRLLGSLVGLDAREIESVAFRPGRSDLAPPQRETLHKLADALLQRPQLTLALPPVLDPRADSQALRTMRVEADLEARLAESAQDEPDMLLAERRRKALEALYDEADIVPPRAEVRSAMSTPDPDSGRPVLDVTAYSAALDSALVSAAELPDSALDELAGSRAAAVIAELRSVAALPDEQLASLPPVTVEADDGLIRMPLELTTRRRSESKAGSEKTPEVADTATEGR